MAGIFGIANLDVSHPFPTLNFRPIRGIPDHSISKEEHNALERAK